jgi:UDP-N-acetylmuramyl pentapeptide phosphotransferase/UDP-N-acetylglucosamine-1-phosphate transferase
MLLKRLFAGSIVAGLTFGAVAATTMESSFAAAPMKPAIKLLVCKTGEAAYRVKIGHHHVWRCHRVIHHHHHHPVKPPMKPMKPMPKPVPKP